MKLNLPTKYGADVMHLLRKTIYTRSYALRPIAFKIGLNPTILSAGEAILEDMPAIISNMSAHIFVPGNNFTQDLVRVSGEFNGAVTMSAILEGSPIELVSEDSVVFNAYKPVSVDILFRIDTGNFTREDNIYFLTNVQENINRYPSLVGFDPSSYKVINSMHSYISNVAYTKEDVSHTQECYNISITSLDGREESEIMAEAIAALQEALAMAKLPVQKA